MEPQQPPGSHPSAPPVAPSFRFMAGGGEETGEESRAQAIEQSLAPSFRLAAPQPSSSGSASTSSTRYYSDMEPRRHPSSRTGHLAIDVSALSGVATAQAPPPGAARPASAGGGSALGHAASPVTAAVSRLRNLLPRTRRTSNDCPAGSPSALRTASALPDLRYASACPSSPDTARTVSEFGECDFDGKPADLSQLDLGDDDHAAARVNVALPAGGKVRSKHHAVSAGGADASAAAAPRMTQHGYRASKDAGKQKQPKGKAGKGDVESPGAKMTHQELYASRLASWQAVSWRKVAQKQYAETDYSPHSPLVRAALYQPSVIGRSFLEQRSALMAGGGFEAAPGDAPGARTASVLGVFAALSPAKLRWQKAVNAIIETKRLQAQAHTLCNPSSSTADKLYAAIRLTVHQHMWEMPLVTRNPTKLLLRRHAMKKHFNVFDSLWDRIDTELYLTGTQLFEWCTPAKLNEHWCIFTVAFTLVVMITFWFMAGQLPYYHARAQTARCAGLPAGNACWSKVWMTNETSYDYLLTWITHPKHPSTRFPSAFLRDWGSRYAPDLAEGQASRWFTSQFLHVDINHLLSNMLLFFVLSLWMEIKYGTARIMVVWFVSIVGAGFLSAAIESPCIQVVGASGGVSGLVGLFIADMVLNFETVTRPILRSLAAALLLGYFGYSAITNPHSSHVSHAGGLLCGLLPSFLILPNLKSERWEAALPLVGILCVLGFFLVLPVWLYVVRFDDVVARCAPK